MMSAEALQRKIGSEPWAAALSALICFQFCSPAMGLEFASDEAIFKTVHPEQMVIDFEGLAPDRLFTGEISPDLNPAIHIDGEAFRIIDGNHISERYQHAVGSDFLVHDRINNEFAIDFDPGVRSVGLRLALSGFYSARTSWPVDIRLFKGQALLDSRQVTVNDVYKFNSFIGYSDLNGATRLELDGHIETNTVLAIDDLRFTQVPEPFSCWYAVIGSLGLYVFRARRKAWKVQA